MVDSGVLVEYLVAGSPYREAVERIIDAVLVRALELYVTPVTISETVYIASRIYELAGVGEPNKEALNFVEWLTARVKVAKITPEIATRAGEIKKSFKIALPDCYVLATAIELNAKALFLKPEKEMLEKIEELKKLPITFLVELDFGRKNSF